MPADGRAGILIVEADVLVRHPLAEYLRDCGYRVVEVSNGDEARRVLAEPGSSVEIVLANVNAPKESGFAFAAWIRANCAAIEVVLVGTVATAVEKAAEICADNPVHSVPHDHKLVHDRIRQLLAVRDRAKGKGEE